VYDHWHVEKGMESMPFYESKSVWIKGTKCPYWFAKSSTSKVEMADTPFWPVNAAGSYRGDSDLELDQCDAEAKSPVQIENLKERS
jgi:hypothetical protein